MARAPAKPIVLVPARVRGDALAHQHARARRGLKHVVNTFDLEGGALLVSPRTDRLRYALCLLSRNVRRIVR